ncbi:peptidoglycan editing factor PgeF [Legionella sp. D16C41]|uniref:peptidoglycan editing factor PgeF n=1 Tax=Legionella sp. D16C41 TaxID=3402688 RepID=UPI003AF743EF
MNNIQPNWTAPLNIFAFTTTRVDGFSEGPYNSNNLGFHVGDNPKHVAQNREMLSANLPAEPEWIEQTHSTNCIVIEDTAERNADAAITRSPDRVLAILTADCLPILLCNRQGTEVAAIHAGWRGLVNGIIEKTSLQIKSNKADLLAWIGPSICGSCYEVGDDVYEQYKNNYPFSTNFFKSHQQKWLANMPELAEQILREIGVSEVYQSNLCTYEHKNHLYSYRREGQTGRIATLIWFTK